jgi:hypothetical protein
MSTLLFAIIAILTAPLHLARHGSTSTGRSKLMTADSFWCNHQESRLLPRWSLVIVVIAVFPFYYAIITSFKTGPGPVQASPTGRTSLRLLENYLSVLTSGSFPRNLLNSIFVAAVTVLFALFLAITASFALSTRALPRPQSAADDDPRRLDVSADRGAGWPVRADPRSIGIYNTPVGIDLFIHDLHVALHRVGA